MMRTGRTYSSRRSNSGQAGCDARLHHQRSQCHPRCCCVVALLLQRRVVQRQHRTQNISGPPLFRRRRRRRRRRYQPLAMGDEAANHCCCCCCCCCCRSAGSLAAVSPAEPEAALTAVDEQNCEDPRCHRLLHGCDPPRSRGDWLPAETVRGGWPPAGILAHLRNEMLR